MQSADTALQVRDQFELFTLFLFGWSCETVGILIRATMDGPHFSQIPKIPEIITTLGNNWAGSATE